MAMVKHCNIKPNITLGIKENILLEVKTTFCFFSIPLQTKQVYNTKISKKANFCPVSRRRDQTEHFKAQDPQNNIFLVHILCGNLYSFQQGNNSSFQSFSSIFLFHLNRRFERQNFLVDQTLIIVLQIICIQANLTSQFAIMCKHFPAIFLDNFINGVFLTFEIYPHTTQKKMHGRIPPLFKKRFGL